MSQLSAIRHHLFLGRSITALDCLHRFDCMNLKGRIFDLRMEGMDIKTQMIKTASGKYIARYSWNPTKPATTKKIWQSKN